jgi:TolB-like protein/Tfp pilus assembly protein PilF
MLAKEPDQRYQLIHDVRTDLGELFVGLGESEVSVEVPAAAPVQRSYFWPAVAGGVMVLVVLALALFWPSTVTAPGESIDSIAILPFENQSDDPELEYLSDGIADSIISSLSQIASLKVMSSSAVRRYKGTDVDPQVVAEELGVRAVMKGRLLRPGDAFSIRVELVDAQDNTQIWGAQYSRQLDEILSLQEEIAQEISQKLRLQISGEEQAQLTVQGTQNPGAYQAYLKGQYFWNLRSEEGFDRAIEYFNQAIAEDSTYAIAYAALADTYVLLASRHTIKEMYPLEMAAALKALEIDPTLAEAHAVMGLIKGHNRDWSGAEAAFKRAIELNPNSSRSHHIYANHFRKHRRFDEALSELRKAQVLDPLSAQINQDIGSTFLFKKEYDEAIKQLETLLTMYPNRGTYWLVRAYWFKGEHEEAIAQAAESEAVFLGHLLSGNREEAIRTLENWTGQAVQVTAARYALLGDKDRAIELLENGLDEGYAGVQWANVWLEFDPLRDDPRFQDLLRRMNLEP